MLAHSGKNFCFCRARMFAAAEAFYVDRRLVGNVLQSFFDGPKAGSEEV